MGEFNQTFKEDKVVEISQAEQRKRKKKNKDGLGDLGDNMKHTHICIIGIPEGDEGEKLAENLFKEVIGKKIP